MWRIRLKDGNIGYVVGNARIKNDNPIAHDNRTLFLCIAYSLETGEIFNVDVDGVLDVTTRFLEDLMVGRSIYTDREAIIADIKARYGGSSKIMLTIALKDACNIIRSRQ